MKRRLLLLILTVLLFCTVGVPAMATVGDTGFSDVPARAWYADAVAYVQDSGLMSGTTTRTFSPNATTSRAMLVTILHRRAGNPPTHAVHFSDVPANAWYRGAADWAAINGIVSGYSNGRFAPNDPVTREQLAAILWRAEGSPPSVRTAPFADEAAISPHAVDGVAWAGATGILGGKSGNRFDPMGLTTRAELAVVLHRWSGIDTPTQPESPVPTPTLPPEQGEEFTMPKLTLQVGNRTFTATLEDNETTRALVAQLPMMVSMGELNGNEKYYYLPDPLPTNSQRPGTLHSGDLMLYGSDCLVLFYETFSSGFSYTRLGSVDDPTGLAAALGRGGIDVTVQTS